jgi:hypothetical protein
MADVNTTYVLWRNFLRERKIVLIERGSGRVLILFAQFCSYGNFQRVKELCPRAFVRVHQFGSQ